MVKYFRKLRQRLIDEGQLRRYLVYAAGEILLVMIGILLALQVNNWNEKNKQRKYQIDQLSNLRTEVISIKNFLKDHTAFLQNAKESNERLLKLMDTDTSPPISPDSINSLVRGTLNTDLVTSERLSLETKIDFKLLPEGKYTRLNEQLLDWRHFIERVGADFQLIEDNRENDLQKAVIDAGIPGWMVLYNNHKPSSFLIDYQSLLDNKEVYAFLYYRYIRLKILINDLQIGVQELDGMLSELEEQQN